MRHVTCPWFNTNTQDLKHTLYFSRLCFSKGLPQTYIQMYAGLPKTVYHKHLGPKFGCELVAFVVNQVYRKRPGPKLYIQNSQTEQNR